MDQPWPFLRVCVTRLSRRLPDESTGKEKICIAESLSPERTKPTRKKPQLLFELASLSRCFSYFPPNIFFQLTTLDLMFIPGYNMPYSLA